MSVANLGQRTWTTREGDVLRWRQMETRHLRNAAALLERLAINDLNGAYSYLSFVQGEAAQMAVESAIDEMEDEEFNPRLALAREMRAYADWRDAQAREIA